jgi:hypothetical protein
MIGGNPVAARDAPVKRRKRRRFMTDMVAHVLANHQPAINPSVRELDACMRQIDTICLIVLKRRRVFPDP